MKRLLLLVPITFLFAGCGGSNDNGRPERDIRSPNYTPHYVGIVTARIAPEGSHEECTMLSAVPYVEQCSEAGNYDYALYIEPLPGNRYTYDGWYETYSLVCVAPSYWRTLSIGSRLDSHRADLHCDG
jgi:hypothetical protein